MYCKKHADCKTVKATGGIFEIVTCPWCGYQVSTSNPCNWCANCYVIFKLEGGLAHFSRSFKPESLGKALAIAIAKSGGMQMCRLTPVAPDRAEARDSDDESPTRAAGEHDG